MGSATGSTEGPWARGKGQMASFTKRLLKVVTCCSLEDKGAFKALLHSWTPTLPPLIFFFFLRQRLTTYPGWPLTHRDPPASAVLGLTGTTYTWLESFLHAKSYNA